MADFKNAVVIDLRGNLPRQSRAFSNSLGSFTSRGRRQLGILRTGMAATGRTIDRLGNRWTALATGAAAAATLRGVVALSARLERLGIQAGVGADKVDLLKRRIFEVAEAPEFRVDPSELISAIETIVEKTGDLDFAVNNLPNIAAALGASGGQGSQIGALVAELKKFGIVTREEVLANLDTLVVQGKAGAFTIGNLASQGERLVSAYAATGRVGPTAVRELGAVIQVIRQGTGSAEMAATAFEAVLRTLQDADKIKVLQKNGIQIFDPGQPDVMRSVADIMADIIRKTEGDIVKISQVFDAEALRAFNAAAGEFKKNGSLGSLEKFLAIQGDGNQIMADAEQFAGTAAAAFDRLATAWQKLADANLAGPINALADALNRIDPDQLSLLIKAGLGGATALVVGSKIAGARRQRRLTRALEGTAGGLAAAGPIPVIVTNWPPQFGAGRRGGGRSGALGRFGTATAAGATAAAVGTRSDPRSRPPPGRASLGSRAGRLVGRAALPLAAGLAVFESGRALADETLTAEEKGAAVGSSGGALAGGAAGAFAGAPFGPAGMVVGATLGAIAGEAAGEKLGEIMTSDLERAAARAERRDRLPGLADPPGPHGAEISGDISGEISEGVSGGISEAMAKVLAGAQAVAREDIRRRLIGGPSAEPGEAGVEEGPEEGPGAAATGRGRPPRRPAAVRLDEPDRDALGAAIGRAAGAAIAETLAGRSAGETRGPRRTGEPDAEPDVTVKIEIEGRAKVKAIESRSPRVGLEVDSGLIMVGP